ncbi:TetR family transcriptional regulator [Streptomyces sp. TG1A-8]|uniref:TetR family transcriptional regulator n=1 Tax=Streptomyces sp. TG1A-8 TaxID=3051385 RepID=UPI00265BC615|nr:TetR family transcriptional regulator [Streptomyces sp. TG1A-8]MDO0925054.1 TetR family transcriptional regulator [Streptomyces sp. TG1A-8]
MARSVEETKRCIIAAAAAEFSEHGISGARVDRIVARAGCGKGLLYTYFGSKEQLFDTVHDELVTRAVDAVPFSADDLPGYAEALYDYVSRNPAVVRLTSWFELERGDAAPPAAVVDSQRRKCDAVVAEQARRRVNPLVPAADLLDMVVALAMLGARPSNREDRRAWVRASVERLVQVV